jgi:pimeloyl-ACP methyl ester carboxylesterase
MLRTSGVSAQHRLRLPAMEKVRSADGTIIAREQSGAGPALVLVSGAFSDRTSTEAAADVFGDRFTVHRYDRRGRGDSGDTAPYAVQREIEDLAAIIDAAGGQAFVFGHSSGAALALEAAAAGVPARSVAAYEPPYTPGPTAEFADELADLAASGRESEAAERFLALTGLPPPVLEQMKSGPYWAGMLQFARTLPYDVRLCNGGSVPADRLAGITVPVLALAGADSADWAGAAASAICSAVPDSRSRVLAGQSHNAAPEVLAPVLEEFFLA